MKNFIGRDIASLMDVFSKLNYILTKRQKQIGVIVFLMTIVGAVMETLGVSIIIPLVQSFTSADQLLQNQYISRMAEAVNVTTATQLIVLMSVMVIIVYIVKNIYMVLLSYVRVKFAVKVRREISMNIMHSYMSREYSYFLGTNTADILRGIGYDVSGVYDVLFQLFRIITEILTAVCICTFIFYTDAGMAVGVVLLMGASLSILMLLFRKKMKKVGDYYRDCTVKVNKFLYESFQGIKDVLVFHKEDYFINNYEREFSNQQKAEVSQTLASESPSYFTEAVCVSGLIIVVSIRIVFGGETEDFIAQLAAFAVAAFRILPMIGRTSAAFNRLIYSCPALNATYNNLKGVETFNPQRKRLSVNNTGKSIRFDSEIVAREIYWKYPNSDKYVIENLNLSIRKGTSVAFIGQSGAGKSTMADILLGLFVPERGDVLVDGESIYNNMEAWKKIVGYVPQSVFLTDDTIRKNIAFGVEEGKIDDEKINRAVAQAQLTSTIEALPNGLDTIMGERGIRFSGGQKQRVAIARALYNDPDILILDEATAALDNDTENAVMEAIDSLHGYKTLIIIAHRLTTIRNCDIVYEIVDGIAVVRDKGEVLK